MQGVSVGQPYKEVSVVGQSRWEPYSKMQEQNNWEADFTPAFVLCQ